MEPQYDNRDFEGRLVEVQKNVKNWPWEEWYDNRTYTNADGEEVRAYEDGQDMTITVMEMQGDGVPDNAGDILWHKPVRTGMTRNYSTSIGLSATLSLPLMVDYKNVVRQQQKLKSLYNSKWLLIRDLILN